MTEHDKPLCGKISRTVLTAPSLFKDREDFVVLHDAIIDTTEWLIYWQDNVIVPFVQHLMATTFVPGIRNMSENYQDGMSMQCNSFDHLENINFDTATFIGGSDNFYHHNMDYLAQLFFREMYDLPNPLLEAEFSWQTELIDVYLGKKTSFTGIGKPTRLSIGKLYIPRKIFAPDGRMRLPAWWDWLRRRTASVAGPGFGAKLYVSRQYADKRRIANNAELQRRLEEVGYTTLHLERMTVPEQIRAFQEAEFVVSPHGAGLTNLIWCRDSCKVVELMPKADWTPRYFENVSRSKGMDFTRIHGVGSLDDPCFSIDVDLCLRMADRS